MRLVPGLGQVPGLALVREPELALGQEPGQVREPELGPGQEPGQGQVPVPHRQVGSQLTTMPAGLIKFSFSSKKLLHLDFVT